CPRPIRDRRPAGPLPRPSARPGRAGRCGIPRRARCGAAPVRAARARLRPRRRSCARCAGSRGAWRCGKAWRDSIARFVYAPAIAGRNPPMLALALLTAAASTTDAYLDQTRTRWEGMSRQLWEYAETGLHADRSAAAIEDLLQKEGFKVERNVAGMPTAFIATAGSGAPVVAIMAEYDALRGLSQKPGEATKDAEKEGAPGHGRGLDLLGASAVGASSVTDPDSMERELA